MVRENQDLTSRNRFHRHFVSFNVLGWGFLDRVFYYFFLLLVKHKCLPEDYVHFKIFKDFS